MCIFKGIIRYRLKNTIYLAIWHEICKNLIKIFQDLHFLILTITKKISPASTHQRGETLFMVKNRD